LVGDNRNAPSSGKTIVVGSDRPIGPNSERIAAWSVALGWVAPKFWLGP
jgi:hypothetical protein